MSNDNGGPAFPLAFEDDLQTPETFVQYGMTLRDYFAAKAMQAWVSDPAMMFNEEHITRAARFSYAMADAMLEARK